MSVWKKAAKSNQKTHRERHQPEERSHLGLLEKKKDYVVRAKDFNTKKKTIKLLRRRALNKNPDEFYHHMVNAKLKGGLHFDKETKEPDTVDQLKLIHSQDLKYITHKRTQELKKIERLQAQLHLTSVNLDVQNKKKIFVENLEEDFKSTKEKELERLGEMELPDVDLDTLVQAAKKKKSLYNQLAKRIERETELAIVQNKIEVKKQLKTRKKGDLRPKCVQEGSVSTAPVFKWKYQRKK